MLACMHMRERLVTGLLLLYVAFIHGCISTYCRLDMFDVTVDRSDDQIWCLIGLTTLKHCRQGLVKVLDAYTHIHPCICLPLT